MSRQSIEASARDVAEPLAEGHGLELVDVQYVKEKPGWILRVFIDKPEGVGLDDCQAMSEALGARLDETDPIPGSYSLEVSSPGLERPLKKDTDFTRFAGKNINIKTYAPVNGRKKWHGTLVGLVEGAVVLDVEDGELRIPKDQVAKANLAVEF